MNNLLLQWFSRWFSELGIESDIHHHATCLCVSRKSVVEFGIESKDLLDELKVGINSTRLYWTGSDENWLYLDSF